MSYIDLTGKRFGRLTVLYEDEAHRQKSGKPVRRWMCRCDCGKILSVGQYNLMRDEYKTVSCGCYAREVRRKTAVKTFTTHGHGKERLYGIWNAMKERCRNPNAKEYKAYGGRGVRVCDEWAKDYMAFREWAYSHGYDPKAKRGVCTIDRINNDGNYEPDNCKISTMKEQFSNTQNVIRYKWHNGEYTLTQIMDISGTKLSRTCLYKRLHKGMSVDEALTTPLMSNQYRRKDCDKQAV